MLSDDQYNEGSLLSRLANNRAIFGIALILVGLAIGLFIAWVLWPVTVVDAPVEMLRADLQEDYMRAAIDSYTLRQDPGLANQRLAAFGETAAEVLGTVALDPGYQDTDAIAIFQSRVLPDSGGGDAGIDGNDTDGSIGDGAGGLEIPGLILVMCTLSLLLLGALGVVYIFRSRNRADRSPTTIMQANEISRQVDQTDYAAMGEATPVAQWMTTYLMGDDLFDDSFSIDAPSGEFMGECGIGIADTIGVGDPKRVSAFEVWLFDKNDIQTVTKVLMSEHAYQDDGIRDRLAAKGEPISAAPGREIALETETLQMTLRVVDMAFGGGALPDNSFFERITIELAVWSKR
ncbi:MAG: hypothetical protein OEZ02_13075 [Anaerolineae bacterium]|nr:hypothetical protein [Anaerolineae bacterium]